MEISELENKISEISQQKGIDESEIISNLLAHLIVNYDYNVSEGNERAIIENIKDRTLDTLYSNNNQMQHLYAYIEYQKIFGFDRLDLNYLERAWNELEAEGFVSVSDHQISMTEKGILKYKSVI